MNLKDKKEREIPSLLFVLRISGFLTTTTTRSLIFSILLLTITTGWSLTITTILLITTRSLIFSVLLLIIRVLLLLIITTLTLFFRRNWLIISIETAYTNSYYIISCSLGCRKLLKLEISLKSTCLFSSLYFFWSS